MSYQVNYFINGDEEGQVYTAVFSEWELVQLEGNSGIEIFNIEPSYLPTEFQN